MIQLANDPKAIRIFPGPAANDARARDAGRGRTGHAWPFPSRYAAQPRKENSDKPAANDSGS
jgi:hypothetical protein